MKYIVAIAGLLVLAGCHPMTPVERAELIEHLHRVSRDIDMQILRNQITNMQMHDTAAAFWASTHAYPWVR